MNGDTSVIPMIMNSAAPEGAPPRGGSGAVKMRWYSLAPPCPGGAIIAGSPYVCIKCSGPGLNRPNLHLCFPWRWPGHRQYTIPFPDHPWHRAGCRNRILFSGEFCGDLCNIPSPVPGPGTFRSAGPPLPVIAGNGRCPLGRASPSPHRSGSGLSKKQFSFYPLCACFVNREVPKISFALQGKKSIQKSKSASAGIRTRVKSPEASRMSTTLPRQILPYIILCASI